MRLKQDVLKTVFYVGTKSGDAFSPLGTAFLLMHNKRMLYAVTAKHVAEGFGDDPIYFRMNNREGRVVDYFLDPTQPVQMPFEWFYHPDESVDIAVLPFFLDLDRANVDYLIISSEESVDRSKHKNRASPVGCGDLCYAIGLFSLAPGTKQNFPVIHTGHIARMSSRDELIPQRQADGRIVQQEGYIVQLSNLGGLSGAPVFVRAGGSLPLTNGEEALLPLARVDLLGVWSGSWEGPRAGSPQMRVPVGMGLVAPSERLLELLNSEPVLENTKKWWGETNAAKADDAPAA